MSTSSAGGYFDLSPTDRALASLHDDAPFAMQLGVDFDARLDDSRLANALELLAARHPILGATADLSDPDAHWRAGTTTPHLVDGSDRAEAEGDPHLAGAALDLGRGPTLLVGHRTDSTGSRLVLGIHHAVTDGRGLLVALDDLRRIYVALESGELGELDVDWTPRTVDALLAAHRVTRSERVLMSLDLTRRWAMAPRSAHADAPGDAGGPSSRHAPTALDDELTRRVDALARRRSWHPNHVMLASLARSWSRRFGEEPGGSAASGWLVTVDGRRPFRARRGVGNLSGLEPVTLHAPARTDLPELVDQTRRAFAPLTRRGAGLAADLVAPPAGLVPSSALDRATRTAIAARTRALRSTRLYSSVDRLPDALGDWGAAQATRVRWLPPADVSPPYVAFVFLRFGDVTTITPYASSAALAPADFAALADELTANLAELVDTG